MKDCNLDQVAKRILRRSRSSSFNNFMSCRKIVCEKMKTSCRGSIIPLVKYTLEPVVLCTMNKSLEIRAFVEEDTS